MFSHMFFLFKLCICQNPSIARAYTAQNTKICALLACLAQPTYPIPARCGTDTAGRGAFEPPPEDGALTKLFDREFQFRESHTEAETEKNSWPNPPKKEWSYIYIYRVYLYYIRKSSSFFCRYFSVCVFYRVGRHQGGYISSIGNKTRL